MELKSKLIILAVLTLSFSACNLTPRNQSRQTETRQTDESDSKVTTRDAISNVVRKGNEVTFDYTVIASKEDLATESQVIANCKTQRYQTTYWAVTKKGVPIMENDKTTEMKAAVGDMKQAIQKACAK